MRQLLLRFRVIPKHPRFITSNKVGDKVGIIFGLFSELSADTNAVFVLIITYIHTYISFCRSTNSVTQQSNMKLVRRNT